MLIGIIGAPNKGKSTIFSALTMVEAEIADYAFTTIKPNIGVAYAERECVEKELGVKCKPRNSLCINGVRKIPVNIIDVAGLVPGAHMGKGMGNQFLNDLISADALILVVDLSGKTDSSGNQSAGSEPYEEVIGIVNELEEWIAGIIMKHLGKINKRSDGDKALYEMLSGFGVSIEQIKSSAESAFLTLSNINWNKVEARKFASSLLKISKPIIIAANKIDKATDVQLDALRRKLLGYTIIGCSGAIELALRKAEKNSVIEYDRAKNSIKLIGKADMEQTKAINYMADFVAKHKGTNVQMLVDEAVFKVLVNLVVYPVEDENKYTDHSGNVLPDALLLKDGSSAHDLAAKIHTDIAKNMLYALDAKKKMRISKDYKVKDNDVIKIVSSAK